MFLGLVCESEHVYLLRTKPNYEKRVRTAPSQVQLNRLFPDSGFVLLLAGGRGRSRGPRLGRPAGT